MTRLWLLPSDLRCDWRCGWAWPEGFLSEPGCPIHAGPVFEGWSPRYQAWASFPFPEPGPLRRGLMLVMN